MNNNVIETATVKGAETGKDGDTTMEKFTFRKLRATDSFLMFKIISKIGINEFGECFSKDSVKQIIAQMTTNEKGENVTTVVGISVIFEMVNVVMGNISKCEEEIYQLLADTSDLSLKEVKRLDFVTFAEMVVEFVKKEEFKDFFKVVLRSFKPEK